MLQLHSTYLIAKDFTRSVEFYTRLFGAPPAAGNVDRWAEFSLPGGCVAVFNAAFDARMIQIGLDLDDHYDDRYLRWFARRKVHHGNAVVLNLSVGDLSSEYQRVKGLFQSRVSDIMYLNVSSPYYFFVLDDPDGNTVEITGGYVPKGVWAI